MKPAARSHIASSFTLIKGAMIDETYAVFAAWDFASSKKENLDRLRQQNFIGANTTTWLRDVAKVLNRRFDPNARDRALVLLADGETLAVAGCPEACVVDRGPRWELARADFGLVAIPAGAVLAGGGSSADPSDDVTRVRFLSDGPSLEPHSRLVHPRTGAVALPLAGGVILVLSGRDAGGIRDESEVCFPPAIEVL